MDNWWPVDTFLQVRSARVPMIPSRRDASLEGGRVRQPTFVYGSNGRVVPVIVSREDSQQGTPTAKHEYGFLASLQLTFFLTEAGAAAAVAVSLRRSIHLAVFSHQRVTHKTPEQTNKQANKQAITLINSQTDFFSLSFVFP